MTIDTIDLRVADPEITVGHRIRVARLNARLKQDELADRVGVSAQLVSKWERDKSLPDVLEAARIADVCNVSFGWLGGVPVRSRCWSDPSTSVTDRGQFF